MNSFSPASFLLSQAFGLDTEAEFSSAYNFAKMRDQFALSLAEYRLQHDLSQTDMAEMLQISQSMISQYESGSRNISLKTLCEYCEKLHLLPQLSFVDPSAPASSQPVDENQLPGGDELSLLYA